MNKAGSSRPGLLEQTWYWGDVDKSTVSKALVDQPDGAFIVRNASTPGDFTLSVKFQGQVKLVKIHVRGGKCGFSTDALIHDSIVALVDYHRTCSLQVYNDLLDIALLYPVSMRRNSHSSRANIRKASIVMSKASVFHSAKTPADWEERLGLERLRIAQTCSDRAARLFDNAHSELGRAEQLHKSVANVIIDLERKMEGLREVIQVQDDLISSHHPDGPKEKWVQCMSSNKTLLEGSIKRMDAERDANAKTKVKLATVMDEMRMELRIAKKRLMRFYDIRNRTYADLVKQGVTALKLDATADSTAEMVMGEPMQVSILLADLPLRWDPAQYLVNNPSKEAAAAQVFQARARLQQADLNSGIQRAPVDGVFLIRPSASQSHKLVLTVLHGDRVSHCLIEQTDKGWGFEHGGLYFLTIGDFVRYYAHRSLEEHNREIRTILTMPAIPMSVAKRSPSAGDSPPPTSSRSSSDCGTMIATSSASSSARGSPRIPVRMDFNGVN